MMRVVVTGKHGQVVSALRERGPCSDIEIIAVGRPEIDLADRGSVRKALSELKPDAIVSAAAYTAVDQAEAEEALAFAINAEAPAEIADVARVLGIPIVHLSTDYVFSGGKSGPYLESDETDPVSVYGRSKLKGEEAIADRYPNHVILRTSWVYSPYGSNFLKTMLRLAETRERIDVVADQLGSPTSALDIADAVFFIINRLLTDSDPDLRGVFHLTGNGEATWADFAEAIFGHLRDKSQKVVTVRRIGTADYPTAAKRPHNSCLSNLKLEKVYGIKLPHWRQSAQAVLDRLV